MRAIRVAELAILAALAGASSANAQTGDENKDLDRIPDLAAAPVAASPPATSGGGQSLYLENAFTLNATRSGFVVAPPPPSPTPWQELLFLDARKAWRLDSRLSLTFSGRLNLREEPDIHFPGQENVRLDLREAYLSWTPVDGTFFDLGRVNLKSGVALGFNPTDFFKTRSVVEPLSADPSVQREDRLGALMVRAQRVWQGGSITIAYAPGLYRPTPIYSDLDLPSLNPVFDRTNAADRWLIKTSITVHDDFSPEFLVYHEGDRTQFGVNLTQSLGNKIVAYAEWAGGDAPSLIDDALSYGRETGTIPQAAPSVLPDDPRRSFMNRLSAGLSYTTQSMITFNLEYHYDQTGFSQADWGDWFQRGQALARYGPATAQLWYIREYAQDQGEILSQQSAFLRFDRTDAFVHNLELSGFVNVDLYDGSGLTQLSADYYLSNTFTIGVLGNASFGDRRTDFGSLPGAASILIKLARYF